MFCQKALSALSVADVWQRAKNLGRAYAAFNKVYIDVYPRAAGMQIHELKPIEAPIKDFYDAAAKLHLTDMLDDTGDYATDKVESDRLDLKEAHGEGFGRLKKVDGITVLINERS